MKNNVQYRRSAVRLRPMAATVALMLSFAADAQPIDCRQLPEAQRANARAAGRCVDPGPVPAVTPRAQGATRVAPPTAVVRPPPPASLIPVPSVLGLRVEEAVERLGRFTPQTRNVPSVRAFGTVVAQDPISPTPRPARATVVLDVSDGSRVLVPNVVGRREADARARLSTNDLAVRVDPREGDAAPGTILEQDPPMGTEVDRQSSVTVVVSTGIGVPRVVGESIDEARRRLARFQVAVAIVESPELERSVVSQDPPAGTRMPADSRVRLDVSDGTLVAVPDLQSASLAEARTLLRDSGLVAALRSGPDAAVSVIKVQAPAARTIVKRGTRVDLDVRAPIAWTLTGLAALAALLAAAVWQWRRRATTSRVDSTVDEELPHLQLPPVRATATIDAPTSNIGTAEPVGAPVRIGARLENAESTLRFEGDQA